MTTVRAVHVYEELRRAILSGSVAPGDRLLVRRVAEEHGVSDIPVREALRMLQRDGLVEMLPYKGARVTVLSPEEVQEAYLIRGHLESLATAEAIGHLTESDFAQLRDCLNRTATVVEAGDSLEYAELNREFHGIILAACPYRRLTDLIVNLWDGQASYQSVFRLNPQRMRASFREHKEIVKLLLKGDKEGVARVTKEHRITAANALTTSLTKGVGPASERGQTVVPAIRTARRTTDRKLAATPRFYA